MSQLNLFSAEIKETFDPLRPWYPIWEHYVLKVGRLYTFSATICTPVSYGKKWQQLIDSGFKKDGDGAYVYMSLCRLLKLEGEMCEVESVCNPNNDIHGCIFRLNVRCLWPNHYKRKANE